MVWFYELVIYVVLWAIGFATILPTIRGCNSTESLIGPALQACLHVIIMSIIVLPMGFLASGVLYVSVFAAIGGAHVDPGFLSIAAILGLAGAAIAFWIGNYVQLKFVSSSTATFDSNSAKRRCAISMTVLDLGLLILFAGINYWMNKPIP
ncbi:MAG: hypothetical protein WC714_09420 [Candidatus Obscuribacterales bacterium]|jgi:hypothetical protein